ncbi:MAG: hypothetical protein IJ590_02305 [Rickettsiales bacterium]|nr:hypothetical protein [Rickettsiales bacterium]
MNEQIGIENIGFYTPNAAISLVELAKHTRQNPDKFTKGLGQLKMSVITPNQDVISMAANAAKQILTEDIIDKIDLVLFATESAVDASKSAAVEVHNLLNLHKNCRCLEVKHACYGGTGAVYLARQHVCQNPQSKALVLMSDIAFYGFKTTGEPTQGCGAMALIISAEPKICTFGPENVCLTKTCNDFFRPSFKQTPIWDGHMSIRAYLSMYNQAACEWEKKYGAIPEVMCCHMPFARMLDKCAVMQKYSNEIKSYASIIGNLYTASLYLGLLSLLNNCKDDLSGRIIGMFSYGSGSECELFSVKISNGYKDILNAKKASIEAMIADRITVNYRIYKMLLKNWLKREKKLNWHLGRQKPSICNVNEDTKLISIKNGARYYK